MRKFLIAAATAVSALAVAAPATAQYYPAPQGQRYNNNYGGVRSLQAQVDRMQRDIQQLAQRRAITRDEYNGLRREARDLERRLNKRSRNGLSYREQQDIHARLFRLQQHIAHEVRDGRSNRYRW